MPRNALLVSLPSLILAAAALCWLAPREFEASAETPAAYPSTNAQLFDATPVGGVLHTIVSPVPAPKEAGDPGVKAQIFDPEVFGSVRSKFSATKAIASDAEAGRAQIEGRSVGTADRPDPARVKTISPEQPRECEPGHSAAKFELQVGALPQNAAAG